MSEDRLDVARPGGRKRCFVVMGFGVKTDLATGRKLDLNKSYKTMIKPAVEAKGLECVRADEIRHSGAIDVPMYEWLLSADVVIADLSTSNPNALYELGIRHALRPQTTIVISENKLPYPFDLNHVRIASYTHLGDAIDYDEVLRFRDELSKTLDAVLNDPRVDSPIYTFLKELRPPELRKQVEEAMQKAADAVSHAAESSRRASAPGPGDQTLAALVAQGEGALARSDFAAAKAMFAAALQFCGSAAGEAGAALLHDPYIQQRLVLATYKAKQPNEAAALDEALHLLQPLQPEVSNDPETMGLAGAIEKRLFDQGRGTDHLERAIRYYGRGFYLRDDSYNGINLAYLLTLHADVAPDVDDNERLADLVWANRIRREVLVLCERELDALRARKQVPERQGDINTGHQARAREQEFWLLATKAEGYFGLGDLEASKAASAEAAALRPPRWQLETLDNQIARLKELLDRRGHLLRGGFRPR
ncbi:DUF4071 domain-containing protein [Roseomonas sp. SSH11]|uniref:DUF4071 domain-containing protein n=1 Tax=Pararoseomonas baculiformis TaxID=2820812 RepID=A0ABS4AH52_9PROT|nr:TRAFs-binding domain-containing protein [Pararoseomonas baculiformis]MBP0445853.1 DUF4071 domain-containing protein [Pararoseomonas baculiformis]